MKYNFDTLDLNGEAFVANEPEKSTALMRRKISAYAAQYAKKADKKFRVLSQQDGVLIRRVK